MIAEISDDAFEEEVRKRAGACVVLFSSPWCGICRKVLPRVEALAGRQAGVKFGKVDISSSAKTATELRVLSIPAVLFFKDGEEKDRVAGDVSEADIEERIARIL